MKRRTRVLFLVALLVAAFAAARANAEVSDSVKSTTKRLTSTSQESGMVDLFNRWERVWHEGKFDLVPSCVAESYIRHDPKGDRTVRRDAYAEEIAKIREDRPGVRVVVYDHSFSGNRAWFRFAFKWRDAITGEAHTQAGMQVYRIADGKLAETWITYLPPSIVWTDIAAQEHWTSSPPIK